MNDQNRIINGHNHVINLWRLVFSIVILFFHTHNFTKPAFTGLLPGGYIGVEFFFMVSGIMMAKHVAGAKKYDAQTIGTETMKYMLNKVKRIYPFHLVAFVFAAVVKCVLLINAGGGSGFLEIAKNFIYSVWELLFLDNVGIRPIGWFNPPAWYISSMLFAMIPLYALLRKNRNATVYIIAPLYVIFFLGYFHVNYNDIMNYGTWIGITTSGVVRALGGLCAGCIIYEMAEKLKAAPLNRKAAILLSVMEVAGYTIVIIAAKLKSYSPLDFVLFLVLGISTMITTSTKASIWPKLNKALSRSKWIPDFTLALYLSHFYWTNFLKVFFTGEYWQLCCLYFAISLLNAVLTMALASVFKKKGSALLQGLRQNTGTV